MKKLLEATRAAIALDIPTLVRFRDSGDAFRRGIAVLLIVALIVGAVAFTVDLIGGLVRPALPDEIGDITQAFDLWNQFLPEQMGQEFREQFLENLSAGLDMGQTLAGLPTRFPRAVSTVFETLGTWMGRPLSMLGGFLGYAIWVMLAAKLLGGQGRLQDFLGTAALSSVPHLLLVLERIPCLGVVLSVVAWIWSIVIWVVATAVAHGWVVPLAADEAATAQQYRIEWGKAILAVILPAAVLAVLVFVLASGLGVAISAAIRAAGG